MITDIGDVLWWWDAADGLEPMVGGDPTFSRASSGLVVPDAGGMVREVVADMPRFPFVSVAGESLPALLLEQADTNPSDYTHSQDIDNAAWTKTNATIDADGAIAPDGQVTADFINETTANGNHRVFQSVTVTDAATVCMAGFFRRQPGASQRDVEFVAAWGGGSTVTAHFLLSGDGSIGTTSDAGSATFEAAYIQALDNGWYLCVVVASRTTGDTSMTNEYRVTVPTEDDSYTGVVGEGLWAWGLFLVDQAIGAVSYPGDTSGGAVIRAAESMQWTGAPTPQALVLYLDMVLVDPILAKGGGERPFELSDSGNTAPHLLIYTPAANTWRAYLDNNVDAAVTADVVVTAPSAGDRAQIVLSIASDGSGRLVVSMNGGAASGTDFSAPAAGLPSSWSGDLIWLNAVGAATGIFAGKYRRLVIVKPDNLDSALDGTEDDELIQELEEIEVNEDRTLTDLY